MSEPLTPEERPSYVLRLTGEQIASIDPPPDGDWFVDWDEYEDFVPRRMLAAERADRPAGDDPFAYAGDAPSEAEALRAIIASQDVELQILRAARHADQLREAAQAVMDVADLYADENENPLWDDIPVELADKLDALRAALDADREARQ